MRRRALATFAVLALGGLGMLAWLGASHELPAQQDLGTRATSPVQSPGTAAQLLPVPALKGASDSPPPTHLVDDPHVVRWPGSTPSGGCDVRVRVLGSDGARLPSVPVNVLGPTQGEQLRGTLLQGTTNPEGEVRFAGLPRQLVLCEALVSGSVVRGHASLVEGPALLVVLRHQPGVTYLQGTVRRAGIAVAGRAVSAEGRDARGAFAYQHGETDELGRYHLALRPGSYHLRVAGAPADVHVVLDDQSWWRPRGQGPWIVAGEVEATGTPPVVERDLAIPATSIEIDVHPPDGLGLQEARAFALLIGPGQEGFASLEVDATGGATFVELPFGPVEVSVVAQGAARWTRRVELSPSRPSQTLRVDLEPGGSVRALLKGPAGDVIDLRAGDPVFVEHLKTGTRVARTGHAANQQQVALFENVPLGRARVFVDEPDTQLGRRHGRLTAPAPAVVEVTPGVVDVILENVHVLAHVLLKAKPPDGQHDRWAHVSVDDADGTRMAPSGVDAHHWSGYLPPGTYRVTLNDGWTGTWEETLEVGTDDVERTFEAPR